MSNPGCALIVKFWIWFPENAGTPPFWTWLYLLIWSKWICYSLCIVTLSSISYILSFMSLSLNICSRSSSDTCMRLRLWDCYDYTRRSALEFDLFEFLLILTFLCCELALVWLKEARPLELAGLCFCSSWAGACETCWFIRGASP